jgi:hypothetical protein
MKSTRSPLLFNHTWLPNCCSVETFSTPKSGRGMTVFARSGKLGPELLEHHLGCH